MNKTARVFLYILINFFLDYYKRSIIRPIEGTAVFFVKKSYKKLKKGKIKKLQSEVK